MLEVSDTYCSSHWDCATVHYGFNCMGSICLRPLAVRR